MAKGVIADLASVILVWVLPATGAQAAASCGAAGFFFVGGVVPAGGPAIGPPVTGIHKARAVVMDRNMEVCDPLVGQSNGDSSVWVMVAGTTQTEYAQIGYGKAPGQGNPGGFTQFNAGECPPTCEWPVFRHREYTGSAGWWSLGTTHTYRVEEYELDPGDPNTAHAVGMWVDGVMKDSTPWQPQQAWGPHDAWEAQFLGETHDLGDDVAGTSSAKATFRNAKVAVTSNGPYYAVASAHWTWMNQYPAAYKLDMGTVNLTCSDCFNIWTQRAGGSGSG